MADTVDAISVRTIAELLRRVEEMIYKTDYMRAQGVCRGAAAMLDGIVAESRDERPVFLLPAPQGTVVRDPTTGRFQSKAA